MFEGARRSRAAIDAAYAEQRKGRGPLPPGPVYAVRGEFAAGVLACLFYLALGGARLLVTGTADVDWVVVLSAATAGLIGGLWSVGSTWHNALTPEAWAPLPEGSAVVPLPRSQSWAPPLVGVFLLLLSPGAMLVGVVVASAFGIVSGWCWLRIRRLEQERGVRVLRPHRGALLPDRRTIGYRTVYAASAAPDGS